jgi:hypothetical protein
MDANSAVGKVLQRRVLTRLESDGWKFSDYLGKGGHQRLMQLGKRDEELLLYCRWHDPMPGTVKQLVEDFLPKHRDARLLVTVRNEQRFDTLRELYPRLHVLELEVVLPPRG